MPDDLFDEFLEYDFTMGADVPCSLFFDNEAECPKCGKKFKKEN